MKVSELRKLIKEEIDNLSNRTKIEIIIDNYFYYISEVKINGERVYFDEVNKILKDEGIKQRITVRNDPDKLRSIADELKPKGIDLTIKQVPIGTQSQYLKDKYK